MQVQKQWRVENSKAGSPGLADELGTYKRSPAVLSVHVRTSLVGILDLPSGRRYRAKEMSSLLQEPSSEIRSQSATGYLHPETLPVAIQSQAILHTYYDVLYAAYGAQHWWPGRTRFEIIVGAILTQNTAWANVEPAIVNLRRENLLTPDAIQTVPFARLAELIRSSGCFRQKAKKLRAFARFLHKEYAGSLTRMFRTPTGRLREKLLSVHGIGPETADSILLYAGGHPVFVVDAYTRRILERHRLARQNQKYDEVRILFEHNLPRDAALYNEFHALIVHTGKNYCRARNPRCAECPLRPLLPENVVLS